MKINRNINPQEIVNINRIKKYDLGNVTTSINDLLNNSEITIEDNMMPILVINNKNYLLPDLNNKYGSVPKRGVYNITEDDLILLGQYTNFVTTFEMNALTPILGQEVYNTDTNFYYYWNGTEWVVISSFTGTLLREEFVFSGSQTFTLANNYAQVYSVEVQGQGALSTSQYNLITPNQVQILDTLDSGDYVVIIYSDAVVGVQPYYSQAEVDALLGVEIIDNVASAVVTSTTMTLIKEYDLGVLTGKKELTINHLFKCTPYSYPTIYFMLFDGTNEIDLFYFAPVVIQGEKTPILKIFSLNNGTISYDNDVSGYAFNTNYLDIAGGYEYPFLDSKIIDFSLNYKLRVYAQVNAAPNEISQYHAKMIMK